MLQLLASGAAAGLMGSRSVAAAAAVDEAEQVGQFGELFCAAQAGVPLPLPTSLCPLARSPSLLPLGATGAWGTRLASSS